MCVSVMNPYIFAFSMSVLSEIHFYFEEKRKQVFVAFFRIISMLFDGEKKWDYGIVSILAHALQ